MSETGLETKEGTAAGEELDSSALVELGDQEESTSMDLDAFEKAPQDVRRSMEAFVGMMSSGPMPNPAMAKLVDKFTPEHITYLLESQDRDADREHRSAMGGRWYGIVCLVGGIAVFVFLVLQFANSNPDLLEKLITIVLAFIGGFGGGVGYKSLRDRNL